MNGLISVLTWCERNIKLGLDPFKRWDWPGMIGIMRAIETRRGCSIIIRGSAQSWKTLTCALWGIYCRLMYAGNMGWYALSGDLAQKTAEEKINPLWEQVEKLRLLVPDKKRTIKKKVLHDNYSDTFSQKTDSDRVQKSLMEIDYDEAWKFEKGNILEIMKRRSGKHADGLYRERLPSTGGEHGCDLEILGREATKYEFRPSCDHCGEPMHYRIFPPKPLPLDKAEKQDLDLSKGDIWEENGVKMFRAWGGFRFLTGDEVWLLDGTLDALKLHASIHYSCEHCGAENPMDSRSQTERVRRSVERDIAIHGEDASFLGNPPEWFGYRKVREGKRNLIEFHFNALMHANAEDVAEEWNHALKARERGEWEPTERFYRERGGLHYSPRFHILDRTRQSTARGTYSMGPLDEPFDLATWWPESADALDTLVVMTQDVQLNHFWVVVRAWIRTRSGIRSRLVYFSQTWSTDENKRIQRHFHACDHNGEFLMDETTLKYYLGQKCTTVVDGNHDVANQIKQAAARNHWVVMRGRKPDGTMHKTHFYHESDHTYRLYGELRLIDAFIGTVLEGGNYPLVAEIPYAAEQCLDILEDFRALGGADPAWSYASDAPEAYEDHLASWVRVPGIRRDGTEGLDWKQQSADDHALDCEKMQIAVIAMQGWIGDPGGIVTPPTPDRSTETHHG